jgi:hypothetical protein
VNVQVAHFPAGARAARSVSASDGGRSRAPREEGGSGSVKLWYAAADRRCSSTCAWRGRGLFLGRGRTHPMSLDACFFFAVLRTLLGGGEDPLPGVDGLCAAVRNQRVYLQRWSRCFRGRCRVGRAPATWACGKQRSFPPA